MDLRQLIRPALKTLAFLAGAWLFFTVLLPVVLPFLLGLLPALAAQVPAARLREKLRLPRWLLCGAVVAAVWLILGGAVFFLCRTVCRELAGFLTQLPELLWSLSAPLEALRRKLEQLAGCLPDSLGRLLKLEVSRVFQTGSGLLASASPRLLGWTASALGRLPSLMVFLFTAVLSSFLFAPRLPAIRAFLGARLPASWKRVLLRTGRQLRLGLGGWLKAQLTLMAVTAVIVTFGLMLVGVSYPLLFGLTVAVVDALPVFGSGTVLIPWSLVCFFQGDCRRGLGLLLLYGAAALTRAALEPRLVGKHMGLSPLLTLFSLYAGFRIFGVAGMILLPLLVLLLRQFWPGSPEL